jgi:hypothetical protein
VRSRLPKIRPDSQSGVSLVPGEIASPPTDSNDQARLPAIEQALAAAHRGLFTNQPKVIYYYCKDSDSESRGTR